MNYENQRLRIALTGAFIVGCISSYVIFSTSPEKVSNYGLSKNSKLSQIDEIQTVSSVSGGIVYAVKNIFLHGWNDVINRYSYHILVSRGSDSGIVESSKGVEYTTSMLKLNNFINENRLLQSFPAMEGIEKCNILHAPPFNTLIINKLPVPPLVWEVQLSYDIRCRGPATG